MASAPEWHGAGGAGAPAPPVRGGAAHGSTSAVAQAGAAVAHAATDAAIAVSAAATGAADAFQQKPFQTTAVALSFLSLIFTVIATFTPLYEFDGSSPAVAGTINYDGTVTPTEIRKCSGSIPGLQPQYTNGQQCTTIPLISVAPALTWLYRAGAVTLAFLIFAIPPSAMATWLTLRRRTGTLRTLAVQGALGDVLRGVIVTPVLHGVTCLFLIVAFASFAGATSSSFNATDFRASAGERNFAIGYGGSFGITIVAALASGAAAALTARYNAEVARNPSAFDEALAASMATAYAAGAGGAPSPPYAAGGGARAAAGAPALPGAYPNDDDRGFGGRKPAAPPPPQQQPQAVRNPFARVMSWSVRKPTPPPAESGGDGLPPHAPPPPPSSLPPVPTAHPRAAVAGGTGWAPPPPPGQVAPSARFLNVATAEAPPPPPLPPRFAAPPPAPPHSAGGWGSAPPPPPPPPPSSSHHDAAFGAVDLESPRSGGGGPPPAPEHDRHI